MTDNSSMDTARLNALERDMGKALEKLENHASRLGELVTKMEKAAEERAEVALLKNQVNTINTHLDAMSKSVNERLQNIENIVQRGHGAKWALNALLTAGSAAAAIYSWWQAHVK